MISKIYENRLWYYTLLKDFLDHKIQAWPFRMKFMRQRSDDLDVNNNIGFSKYYQNIKWTESELRFRQEYFDRLYNYSSTDDVSIILSEYVQGAKKYKIEGPLFFSGIFSDLSVNIRDFYPKSFNEAKDAGWIFSSDESGFQEFNEEEYKEDYCIDEVELRRKVEEKFKILEENKERWEYKQDESVKI